MALIPDIIINLTFRIFFRSPADVHMAILKGEINPYLHEKSLKEKGLSNRGKDQKQDQKINNMTENSNMDFEKIPLNNHANTSNSNLILDKNVLQH